MLTLCSDIVCYVIGHYAKCNVEIEKMIKVLQFCRFHKPDFLLIAIINKFPRVLTWALPHHGIGHYTNVV